MQVCVFPDVAAMSEAAAADGATRIRQALAERGQASIIVATGTSQLTMLSHLVRAEGVDWQRVTGFHLDEYIGLPFTHNGSFRGYLWQHFASQLPVPLRQFHFLNGEIDAPGECERVGSILARYPIDVAFVGIGENGHLAFNDPPADFEAQQPYLCVKLDQRCRQQQLGEGWFPSIADVPTHAITMSIRQILKSRAIVCTVPDERKAEAVQLGARRADNPKSASVHSAAAPGHHGLYRPARRRARLQDTSCN